MSTTNGSGALVDRTLANLRNAWHEMTDSARVALTGAVRPDLRPEDAERINCQIMACLEGRGDLCARPRRRSPPHLFVFEFSRAKAFFKPACEFRCGRFGTRRSSTTLAVSLRQDSKKGGVPPLAQIPGATAHEPVETIQRLAERG